MALFGCVSDEQFNREVGSEWPSWSALMESDDDIFKEEYGEEFYANLGDEDDW